ncbi:transposable element Tc1 transposase [Trichonephila clavipes]|nr:transposable element Tc1 transposase [Trichonephila clavipes]
MPQYRIQAHYEQLSEFERVRIIGFDESRFQLCPDDHRNSVWRRPGHFADFAFVIVRHTCPQPGAMQNNTTPHTACVVVNRLTACQRLPWPARLLGISPIMHIRDMMGRRLYLPENVDDLVRQLEQI